MVRSITGKRPEYYEAILQLRDISSEVYDYALEEIRRTGIHLAKEEYVRGGVDFYLADSDFTKNLGKRIQLKFGGKYLITASLFTNRDGRNIYRLTILIRGLPFKKGDLVEYKGNVFKVNVLGKEMILQNVSSGKKVHVKYKEMDLIKKKIN